MAGDVSPVAMFLPWNIGFKFKDDDTECDAISQPWI